MDTSAADSQTSSLHTRARLYWRCRRGMLELDYMLQTYLQRHYASMTTPDMARFARLLETPDALLLEYLMGRSVPMDPEMARVVREIRDAT